MMTKRFEDKVVVITGGSDGIGLASAQLFAEEGALVYITARRQALLDDAVRQIGHGAVGVQGDVTNLADLTKLYDRVARVRMAASARSSSRGQLQLQVNDISTAVSSHSLRGNAIIKLIIRREWGQAFSSAGLPQAF